MLSFGRDRIGLLRSWKAQARLLALNNSSSSASMEAQPRPNLLSPSEINRSEIYRCGLLDSSQVTYAQVIRTAFLAGCPLSFGLLPLLFGLDASTPLCAGVGLLCGVIGWRGWLRYKRERFSRALQHSSPLVLESLLLLVQAGYGFLSAIHLHHSVRTSSQTPAPLTTLLHKAYQITSYGTPFQHALKRIANTVDHPLVRHVFLHLELAESEGGAVASHLRSLSDYTQQEWKLSVEERVKRLENLAVIPIFSAVIGLMLLTAAVPIIPLFELRDHLPERQSTVAYHAHSITRERGN